MADEVGRFPDARGQPIRQGLRLVIVLDVNFSPRVHYV